MVVVESCCCVAIVIVLFFVVIDFSLDFQAPHSSFLGTIGAVGVHLGSLAHHARPLPAPYQEFHAPHVFISSGDVRQFPNWPS